jgi:hypothetical protein
VVRPWIAGLGNPCVAIEPRNADDGCYQQSHDSKHAKNNQQRAKAITHAVILRPNADTVADFVGDCGKPPLAPRFAGARRGHLNPSHPADFESFLRLPKNAFAKHSDATRSRLPGDTSKFRSDFPNEFFLRLARDLEFKV